MLNEDWNEIGEYFGMDPEDTELVMECADGSVHEPDDYDPYNPYLRDAVAYELRKWMEQVLVGKPQEVV